jgi:hypothetical protein
MPIIPRCPQRGVPLGLGDSRGDQALQAEVLELTATSGIAVVVPVVA